MLVLTTVVTIRIVEQIIEIVTENKFLNDQANVAAVVPVDVVVLAGEGAPVDVVDDKTTTVLNDDPTPMPSRNEHKNHKSPATFQTPMLLSKFATRVHLVEVAVKQVLFVTL